MLQVQKIAATAALAAGVVANGQNVDVQALADVIRAETLRPNQGPQGRPLPLAANWNKGGVAGKGFTPAWQVKMLSDGRHLLPWFPIPDVGERMSAEDEAALRWCAQYHFPITFIGTQWERLLTSDPRFSRAPREENANVFGADGAMQPRISPFGPVEPWRTVGKMWGSAPAFERAQQIYPDPPRIIFLSNNEHTKLAWTKVEEDRLFLEKYGANRDDEFKRRVVGDGWIERYRALQAGFRDGLPSAEWKNAARFVGYNAFGQEAMGRWVAWEKYSLHVPNRISPWPLAWDGGSPSFYTNNWEMSTDYTVYSPQVQAMNWVFMLKEAHRLNPDFWFEASLWDGRIAGKADDKYAYYAERGQTYPPERYGGLAQFALWLMRPRAIREFRSHRETRAEFEPHFQAVMTAVDRIYADPTLTEFWRFGEIVPNRAQQHPYVNLIPDEYQKEDRWFRLQTDLDPTEKWRLETELPVFSLALVRGDAPARRWLVYAHAPLGDRAGVRITIPEYKPVQVNVSQGGSFNLVDEASGRVQSLFQK